MPSVVGVFTFYPDSFSMKPVGGVKRLKTAEVLLAQAKLIQKFPVYHPLPQKRDKISKWVFFIKQTCFFFKWNIYILRLLHVGVRVSKMLQFVKLKLFFFK